MTEEFDWLLLEELGRSWARANWTHFRDGLVAPVLRLGDLGRRVGTWDAASRTIAIDRGFAWTAPWPHVVEVLHHEMAHQYVREVLHVGDESAHGPAFRQTCARMGIDARASGEPVGVPAAEGAALRRIRKLLALADSPNQYEAESAMKAAHRLMLQHQVALRGLHAAEGYTVRTIGPARARHPAWETLLVGILSKHFFVRIVWVPELDRGRVRRDRSGTQRLAALSVAEAQGTNENLEIAQYVHGFLTDTGQRLWVAHRRAARLSGDRERQRFLAGIMVGFRKKLDENVVACAREGLVWVPDAGLDDFVSRRFPKLTSRGSLQIARSAEFQAGEAAGRAIVLHKPIRSGSSGSTPLLG